MCRLAGGAQSDYPVGSRTLVLSTQSIHENTARQVSGHVFTFHVRPENILASAVGPRLAGRYDFRCAHCGRAVPWGRYSGRLVPRSHCPRCLWSKHVEMGGPSGYPPCGGMMRPAAADDGNEITWRCAGCGFTMRGPTDDHAFAMLASGLARSLPVTVYGCPR
jgi:RNHCP domain